MSGTSLSPPNGNVSKAARGSQAGQDCDDRASGPRAAEHVTTTEGANFPTPYGEIYDRNLGSGSTLGIPRGMNQLWNLGGIQYAPPIE